jgi:flagellar protein FlaI
MVKLRWELKIRRRQLTNGYLEKASRSIKGLRKVLGSLRPKPSAPPVAEEALKREIVKIGPESIIDSYRVNRWVYAIIYFDEKERPTYMPVEPYLTPEQRKALEEVRDIISKEPIGILPEHLSSFDEAVRFYARYILLVSRRYGVRIPEGAYGISKLSYYLARDLHGYGEIDPLIRDPWIEDVVGDGGGIPIYVFHRRHEWLRTTITPDVEEMEKIVKLLAFRSRRNLNVATPIVEGNLKPEGFRVHLTLGVVSGRGSTFTIRKYTAEPLSLADLVRLKSIDERIAGYLWLAVDYITSMLVAGPMGSGKTTLLNAVAMMIRPEAKVVTLEDTPELRLPHENWVPMYTRPSFEPGVKDIDLFELLKSSLRQRPEYVIVGEIRGSEAYTFFQAITIGHGGLGTIHGETIEQVIRRLQSPPMNVPRELIPLVKVYILLGILRGEEGIGRRLLELREAAGYDPRTQSVILNKLFVYDPVEDTWTLTGRSVLVESIAERTGLKEWDVREDWARRATIIKYLARKKARYSELVAYVRRYRYNPEATYREAESVVGRVEIS